MTLTTKAQQLADFEAIKKKLMKDLQARCEQVVELELSLDEAKVNWQHHRYF
jgi:kinesin family protein 5